MTSATGQHTNTIRFWGILMITVIGAALCSAAVNQGGATNAWLAKRPVISQIRIEGNTFFSDTKIKGRLFSRENSFWESFRTGSRNRVLRYSVNRDTMEVKYLYLRAGFLNVRVEERYEMAAGNDSSAIAVLTIAEGNRFMVGGVKLEASTPLPFYGRLAEAVTRLKAGDPVDPIIVNQVTFDLKTVLANNGYPYAVVQEVLDSAAGPSQTTITFKAAEGALVRFGRLNVKNLRQYKPYLVRREIAFREGDLYSRQKIIESQKRLYATGLFNTVNLNIDVAETVPGGDSAANTTPNFTFSAIERKPHFVSMQTGAGQDPQQDLIWDASAAWGKRNIFISRRIEFTVNTRYIIFTQWRPLSHRFQVQYTEPRFFNFRMPLTLTARYEPGVRSQKQPYRIQTWGISLSTRKDWSEQLYAVIIGEYENVNIYGVTSQDALVIRQNENISIRRKLTVTLAHDTRLDKFVPRSGSYTTYLFQYVGGLLGGDDSFLKGEFSWARYQPAFGSVIYATRFKTGWVKEFNGSHSVPIDDRFFLGGANSIRGFRENSIGPRSDGGYPSEDSTNIGANVYAIFNQELRTPLFWKIWGTVFSDVGNGWETLSQIRLKTLLLSYGLGLEFLSPAGPLRVDYARRIKSSFYRADHRLHFTILFAF